MKNEEIKSLERRMTEMLDNADISLADTLLRGVNPETDNELSERLVSLTLAKILPEYAPPVADINGTEKGTCIKMNKDRKRISKAAIAIIAAATAVAIGTISVGAAYNWDYSRVFGALFGERAAKTEGSSMRPEVTELSNTFSDIDVSIDGIAGDSGVLYVIATLTKNDGTVFGDAPFYYANHGWELDDGNGGVAPVSMWLDTEREANEIKHAFCCDEPYESFAGRTMTFRIINIHDFNGQLISEGEWTGSFDVTLDGERAEYDINDGSVNRIVLSAYSVQVYTNDVKQRLAVTMADGTMCNRYMVKSAMSNGDNSMIFYAFDAPVDVSEIRSVQVGGTVYTFDGGRCTASEPAQQTDDTSEVIGAEVTAVVKENPEEKNNAAGMSGDYLRYFLLGYDKNGNAIVSTLGGENDITVLYDDNSCISYWEKENPKFRSGEEIILDKLTRTLDNGYCELVCEQHGDWSKNQYLEELDIWSYDYEPNDEQPDRFILRVHTFEQDSSEILTVQTADGSISQAYAVNESCVEYDVTDILSGDIYYAYRFIGAAVNDDTTKIAYTDGFMNNAIYLCGIDGGDKKQIFADESMLITNLVYTGEKIAFNATVGDKYYLCVINEDGTGLERAEYKTDCAPQILNNSFLWSTKSGVAVVYDGEFRELAVGGALYSSEYADVFAGVTQSKDAIKVTVYSSKTGEELKSLELEADESAFVTDIAVGKGELLVSLNRGSVAELRRLEF